MSKKEKIKANGLLEVSFGTSPLMPIPGLSEEEQWESDCQKVRKMWFLSDEVRSVVHWIIGDLRVKYDKTQQEVADHVGCSQETIAGCEKIRNKYTYEEVLRYPFTCQTFVEATAIAPERRTELFEELLELISEEAISPRDVYKRVAEEVKLIQAPTDLSGEEPDPEQEERKATSFKKVMTAYSKAVELTVFFLDDWSEGLVTLKEKDLEEIPRLCANLDSIVADLRGIASPKEAKMQ